MDQRSTTMGLLFVVCLMFGGMLAFELNQNKEQHNPVITNDTILSDSWGTSVVSNTPNKQRQSDPIVRSQITASSYKDAIKKSGEKGMPVMIFFEADWCGWCKKMKDESLSDKDVKKIMKNYILVFVDYDRNTSVARKFGVKALPSYAITNMNETNLKSDAGYLNAKRFHNWLDNPSMYKQPKKEGRVTPSPLENRRRFRQQQPE